MQTLTNEQLRQNAPAVFATKPASRMSDKYVFIPTYEIVDQFKEAGWEPVKATQALTKKSDVAERSHIVRLSNPAFAPEMPEVGSITPQIILKNSHNGTSGIQLNIGLYRLVCSNGLIVADTDFAQIKRRHMGIEKEEVQKAIYDATKELPDIFSKINDYRSINLTQGQKVDFAINVIESNWGENSIIEPQALLTPRRREDEGDDLFTTYNILQESVIKGGATYINQRTNRPRRTRAIKNADRDFMLNKSMWIMMETFRNKKKFR